MNSLGTNDRRNPVIQITSNDKVVYRYVVEDATAFDLARLITALRFFPAVRKPVGIMINNGSYRRCVRFVRYYVKQRNMPIGVYYSEAFPPDKNRMNQNRWMYLMPCDEVIGPKDEFDPEVDLLGEDVYYI